MNELNKAIDRGIEELEHQCNKYRSNETWVLREVLESMKEPEGEKEEGGYFAINPSPKVQEILDKIEEVKKETNRRDKIIREVYEKWKGNRNVKYYTEDCLSPLFNDMWNAIKQYCGD